MQAMQLRLRVVQRPGQGLGRGWAAPSRFQVPESHLVPRLEAPEDGSSVNEDSEWSQLVGAGGGGRDGL